MNKFKAVQFIVISMLLFVFTGCGRLVQSSTDVSNSSVSLLPPQNLRALEGNQKIVLVWDNPSDVDFNGVVVQRVSSTGSVMASSTEFSPSSIATLSDGYYLPKEGTALPEKDLHNGETYLYRVWAKDAAGNYSPVLEHSATPKDSQDTTPPGNVSSIRAVNIGYKVFLNWVNPIDSDFKGVIVIRREGRYPESINDGVTIYIGDKNAFTDSKVDQGKTYYYSLFSYDSSLNFSNASNIVISVRSVVEKEFRINTSWTADQKSPSVTSLSQGGFVVACLEKIAVEDHNILLNIFDNTGKKVVNEKKLVLKNVAGKCIPVVCDLKNGTFVLTWESNTDVFAQVFDYKGNALTEEIRVNATQTDVQDHQVVASLRDGKFVVAWETNELLVKKFINYKIYSYANGQLNVEKNDTKANQYNVNNQKEPAISVLKDGNFVILWQSKDSRYTETDIAGRVFDSYGNPIVQEFRVNEGIQYYTNYQKWVAVDTLMDGSFVVSWVSGITDASSPQGLSLDGIYSRKCRFTGSSVTFSSIKKVNTIDLLSVESTFDGTKYQVNYNAPQILGLVDGGYMVGWENMDSLDGQGYSVRAQRFDANNEKIGSEYQLNQNGRNDQKKAALASLTNGDVIIVWQSDQDRQGNQDIWGTFER